MPPRRAAKRKTPDESEQSPSERRYISKSHAKRLLRESQELLDNVGKELQEAKALAERAGLSIESSIQFELNMPAQRNPLLPPTTAGHSNRDHLVVRTGDRRTDRIAELKRNMVNRARDMQPEDKGNDRWDKPKMPGERRRRIVREKDRPGAPPEPPPSGYIVFIGQMTTKIRHDRPKERHNQARVMQEISRLWKFGLNESDREYYHEFATEARREYANQHMEYRATGHYTPSSKFEKLEGSGPWVRISFHEKNGLEREIAEYDTVLFPMRPPEFEEAYRKREEESKRRRKLRLKGLLNPDGTIKEGGEADSKPKAKNSQDESDPPREGNDLEDDAPSAAEDSLPEPVKHVADTVAVLSPGRASPSPDEVTADNVEAV